ncbi:MAG: transglutaminase-like domain-containing protein, partial [Methylomonas lenta]|nr:transglutaminase-like domain-containing protein [Methylomonas lenta]
MNNDSQEDRQLRFSIALKNPSNMELHDQFLWIYIPATSSKQHLKNLNASIDFDLETDILNQNIMKFEFPKIGPLSTKIINVTAQIGMIREGKTESVEKSVWLQAEHLIESNNLQIKLLALQLKQDTDANTCRGIYQWASEHISYAGYIADDLGALYALNQQRGDCTEYACLAAALARANGIPARMVGGYVSDKDFV